MAEDSDLEKTESASPRRLEQAREEGQVARSRELSTFALLAAGFGGLYVMSDTIGAGFAALLRRAFTFDRAAGFDTAQMLHRASRAGLDAAGIVAPLFAMTTLAALLAPLALGGWLLTTKPLSPNFGRLNPLPGLARMFSLQALVGLGMAIGKCAVVGTVAALVIRHNRDAVLQLLTQPVDAALLHGTHLVGVCAALIVSGLLLLAMVDVPYQLWTHAKKLRMTKEELKREHRESEGDPHIKGKIRAQQRAMARRRMMASVPQADVIVTNPTHFAVALQYRDGAMGAPRVIAKGSDLVAAKIREMATAHHIPILEAPPLARALYHHTELEQEIPAALYGAVAEVLAWVYQLRRWRDSDSSGAAPPEPADLAVPHELDVPADLAAPADHDVQGSAS